MSLMFLLMWLSLVVLVSSRLDELVIQYLDLYFAIISTDSKPGNLLRPS